MTTAPTPIPIPRLRSQCTIDPLPNERWLANVWCAESEFRRIYTIDLPTEREAAMEALARFEEEYPHGYND